MIFWSYLNLLQEASASLKVFIDLSLHRNECSGQTGHGWLCQSRRMVDIIGSKYRPEKFLER
jgi:hypothetical protein